MHRCDTDEESLFKDHLASEPWTSKQNYELYGVVSHSGSIRGGHYVSYIARTIKSRKQWFYISDAHVSEVQENDVLRAEAYMLFYLRVQ